MQYQINQKFILEGEENCVLFNIDTDDIYIFNESSSVILNTLLLSDSITTAMDLYFEKTSFVKTSETIEDYKNQIKFLFSEEIIIEVNNE